MVQKWLEILLKSAPAFLSSIVYAMRCFASLSTTDKVEFSNTHRTCEKEVHRAGWIMLHRQDRHHQTWLLLSHVYVDELLPSVDRRERGEEVGGRRGWREEGEGEGGGKRE